MWTFFLCFFAVISGGFADVTQNFDSIVDDTGYEGINEYGEWESYNCRVGTDNPRGGTGRSLVMNKSGSAPYLLYKGSDGSGKSDGLGTVSVWYRHWNGKANAVSFVVEYSQNGGGTWFQIGGTVVVTSTDYASFSAEVNIPGDGILVRFRSVEYGERLCLDDVTLTDFAGAVEDPNLYTKSSLLFGTILPDATATQVLTIANSGATQNLHLYSFEPHSGDTNRFSTGAFSVSSLAPSGNMSVEVVYNPGGEEAATHSAVWCLATDDPGTPSHLITFSGQTIGAGLSVSNVQYTTASGGVSPLNGTTVSVKGIASYADPSGYVLMDAGGGPWSGIYVADVNHRPKVGDMVCLDATVQESSGMTQLTGVTNYFVLSGGHPLPVTTIRANQITNEAYEGVLVQVTNVTVVHTNYQSKNSHWQVRDSTGTLLVASRVPLRYIWTNNEVFSGIQGVVFTLGGSNAVSPRFDADLIGRRIMDYALRGVVMTPDGPQSNWVVHVQDDVIAAVGPDAPEGVQLVETGGIIFPGLIDTHNHPSYNSFPTLMFNNFPFGHRDEWGESDSEYSAWKTKRTSLRSHNSVNDSNTDKVTKYGECLELMAGCIAIQGQSNSDIEHSYPPVILRNIEQFPSRTWQDIFPFRLTNSAGATTRAILKAKIDGGAVNATMIHLCEGTDTVARAQFTTWKNWGLLDETTVIIHGAALQAADFRDMAAAGAKLVWSPMSNMRLYAGTADVKAAKEAGVLIGLAPDWTPSGCYNLLEELGYAWKLNQTKLDHLFTPRELCDMVTVNNAICAGWGDTHGKIQPGYNAGLVVIDGTLNADPYLSLIHARPTHVKLTIVDGTPRYGDVALMAELGIGGDTDVDVHGRSKRFNIAIRHPYLEYGHHTFAEIVASLRTGHGTLVSTGELDKDELQFLDFALLQGAGDDVAPFRADSPIASAPSTTITYDKGSNLTMSFRYQDFWDNETFLTDLTHTIDIVPAAYTQFPLQTIATNWPNTKSTESISFTVDFVDMHTNYLFAFHTMDDSGNIRRTVTTNAFKLRAQTGGDTDRDGIPNEWEIAYFNSFTGAVASADADADGLNNLEEYIADLSPVVSNSLDQYAYMSLLPGSTENTLQLITPDYTSPNRVYDAWFTTNLCDNHVTWTPLNLNRPGTGNALTLTITNQHPAAFYHIGVKLP